MTQIVPATTVLGPGKTGLSIGYRVLDIDRVEHSAFSTAGVSETGTLGTYSKSGGAAVPDAGGYIVWGVSGTDYAEATVESTAVNVVELDGDTEPLDNLVLSIGSGGFIKANLVQILGTTITETAGLIAGAFSKFFNKAGPTGTINSLPDAVAGASGGLALTGADGDTLETLSDQLDAIQAITDDIDVSAVTVTTSNNVGELTIKRTATFAATVSGLVIPADWTVVLWTLKGAASDDDDDAVLQVRVSHPGALTDGLQRIEGAAPSGSLTAASGSCTVSQAGGTVALALKAAATAALTARGDAAWDLRVLRPPTGEAEELTTGTVDIQYTVTHART